MPRIDGYLNLGASFTDHLKSIKVFTLLDFINADIDKLTTTSFSASDVISLKHKLIQKCNKNYETGVSWYNASLKKTALLLTHIKSLDELLKGGLETGHVYEIAGLSGSGKTQLCFKIIASVVSKLKRKVFYLDTKNDFSASRIHSIISENYPCSESEAFLDNITVFRTNDLFELISTLYSIRETLETSKKYDFRLLVLDSITAPYLEHIGSKCFNQAYSILMQVGATLKQLAREMHLVILVTNLAIRYSETNPDILFDEINHKSDDDTRVSLGRPWAHVPHTRFCLQQTDSSDTFLLTIMKSNCHPVGKSISFYVGTELQMK